MNQEYAVGDTGHFNSPAGRFRATVLRVRGNCRYDLLCPDVDFGETQTVPLDPARDDHGRWFEPDNVPVPATQPPAPDGEPVQWMRAPRAPMWPSVVAAAMAAAALALELVHLLGGP